MSALGLASRVPSGTTVRNCREHELLADPARMRRQIVTPTLKRMPRFALWPGMQGHPGGHARGRARARISGISRSARPVRTPCEESVSTAASDGAPDHSVVRNRSRSRFGNVPLEIANWRPRRAVGSGRHITVFPDDSGEPAGTRTQDHLIKSQVLYQLSYGLCAVCVWGVPGQVNRSDLDLVRNLADRPRRPTPRRSACRLATRRVRSSALIAHERWCAAE
jgi:hypothetical protein